MPSPSQQGPPDPSGPGNGEGVWDSAADASLVRSLSPGQPQPQSEPVDGIRWVEEVPEIPMGRLRPPKPMADTRVTQHRRHEPGDELHRHTVQPESYSPGDLHSNPNSTINPLPEIVDDPHRVQEIETAREFHEESSCPSCGSPTDQGAHFCPACGEGLDPAENGPGEEALQEESDRRRWKCDNCGSEITAKGSERTLHCPFCESDYVAEIDSRVTGRQRPEFIIGFGITREEAASRIAGWMESGSWYHPKDLKNARVVKQLKGVYIPFWSFSTLANSRWRASIGEYWYRTETYTVRVNGKTQTRTRRVRHTEWWPLAGRHHQYYSGYLVSGSHGLKQVEADSLLPFNLPSLQRYQPYFLAGWFAEEYSVEREQAMQRSLQQFAQWEENNVKAFLPGDTYSNVNVETQFSKTQSDLCLLPIYMLTYSYNGQRFRVLLNGQTGRIYGKKPIWRARIMWVVGFIVGLILLVGIIAMVMQLH